MVMMIYLFIYYGMGWNCRGKLKKKKKEKGPD